LTVFPIAVAAAAVAAAAVNWNLSAYMLFYIITKLFFLSI
jgi:hypothetical protein